MTGTIRSKGWVVVSMKNDWKTVFPPTHPTGTGREERKGVVVTNLN
jgi:hypothetical protein